jgi:hypothetical protein
MAQLGAHCHREVMPAARTFKEFGLPKGIRTDNGVLSNNSIEVPEVSV